jgi:hypothetical protein
MESGQVSSIDGLRDRLKLEGYQDGMHQTSYPTVRKQLCQLIQGDIPRIAFAVRVRRTRGINKIPESLRE